MTAAAGFLGCRARALPDEEIAVRGHCRAEEIAG